MLFLASVELATALPVARLLCIINRCFNKQVIKVFVLADISDFGYMHDPFHATFNWPHAF